MVKADEGGGVIQEPGRKGAIEALLPEATVEQTFLERRPRDDKKNRAAVIDRLVNPT